MEQNTLISFKNISKEFSGNRVLNELNFNISTGTVHGFIGPNGAGKSTTMKILAGLIPATSGKIYFNNSDITTIKDKSNIAFLAETPALYKNMIVNEYLSFIYSIYHNDKVSQAKLEETLNVCSINNIKNRLINHLSKGYRQKVGIASALIINPTLIILDEPIAGLDPIAQRELRSLIISLKKHHTIFISSHLLNDISLICDDVTFISQGEIKISSPKNEILSSLNKKQKIIFHSKNFTEKIKVLIQKEFKSELKYENIKNTNNIKVCLELKDRIEIDVLLNFLITKANQKIIHLREEENTLEDLFT